MPAEMITFKDIQVANVVGGDLRDLPVANVPGGNPNSKIRPRRIGEPRAGSLESTREIPGLVLVAPFSLLRKLSQRLDDQEKRLGRSCCLPLPVGPFPYEVEREFFALPHSVLQLAEGPLDAKWGIPILADETVVAHTTLTAPFQGMAAYIARVEELPRPEFDVSMRERIAQALADALLEAEKLR
jgi:hypothetical protein